MSEPADVTEALDLIARVLNGVFTSPNVIDSNFEKANVVDTLDHIGNGLFAIARAIEHSNQIAEGLEHIH